MAKDGKPPIGLLLGLKPHDDGDEDEDDYSEEGLQKACDEVIEAAGLDVPEDKREEFCDALLAFVHMAMNAPPPKDEDEEEEGGEIPTPEHENE